MEDFNIDVDNSNINRQHHTLKLNFIHQLAALDMYDCYNLVHKDTTLNVHITWSHLMQNLHSRIDYIWISQSLIQQFIYCSLLRTTLYQSDHKMILLSLDKCQLFDALLDTHYNRK